VVITETSGDERGRRRPLMQDLLFDTHAFITMFERQPGWEIVRDYMRAVDDNECSGFIPTVVLHRDIVFV